MFRHEQISSFFFFLYDRGISQQLRNQLKTLIGKQTTTVDLEKACEVIIKEGKIKVRDIIKIKKKTLVVSQ